MKTTTTEAKKTPKVRKFRIGFGIAGAIVILLSTIASYLIITYPTRKLKKYSKQWDGRYGILAKDEEYNVLIDLDEYWCFCEDGKGVLVYTGETLPTVEEAKWLQRGREKFKNNNVDDEMLAAAKYDYLMQKGYFLEDEPEIVRMFGVALFDNKDKYTEEELAAIRKQLAIVFYYCSTDPSDRAE